MPLPSEETTPPVTKMYFVFILCGVSSDLFFTHYIFSAEFKRAELGTRQGRVGANFTLLFWLNENVGFLPSFSRHAKADASIALVIWLNENVVNLRVQSYYILMIY
jgi:hypothetical protein